MTCQHGYPERDVQRCALCRAEVLALHDPHGIEAAKRTPHWKLIEVEASRGAVPMPGRVRALLDELQQGRRPTEPEPWQEPLL